MSSTTLCVCLNNSRTEKDDCSYGVTCNLSSLFALKNAMETPGQWFYLLLQHSLFPSFWLKASVSLSQISCIINNTTRYLYFIVIAYKDEWTNSVTRVKRLCFVYECVKHYLRVRGNWLNFFDIEFELLHFY